jgi:hypothetical protein
MGNTTSGNPLLKDVYNALLVINPGPNITHYMSMVKFTHKLYLISKRLYRSALSGYVEPLDGQ